MLGLSSSWVNAKAELAFASRAGRALQHCRKFAFKILDELVKLLVVRKNRESSIIVKLDAIGDFFIWMQSGALEITAFAKSHGNSTILLANPS